MTVTDGAGRVTRTVYDLQNRVTEILYNNTTSCATGHVNCLDYTYDGAGRLTQRVSDQGTTTYTYDLLGRLTQKALPVHRRLRDVRGDDVRVRRRF